jgi:2-polyprenyl-3-methyl-5-hydroxy-6-metoxy-1,4-benzoquinol methylase
MKAERSREVAEVFGEIVRAVAGSPAGSGEIGYLGHRSRFERSAQRVLELVPRGGRILDIGSHFLHLGMLLAGLGYKVTGIDVAAFASLPEVKQRATKWEIENRTENSVESGAFLEAQEDSFDAVVFTEALEHVTFNPILFWHRVWELLKPPDGLVYITTPNSLAAWKTLSQLKRLVLREGIGIPPSAILGNVTYGHHWKEYSAAEVVQLFSLLSPDWVVEVSHYQLPAADGASRPSSPKQLLRSLVDRGSGRIWPGGLAEIEAIVRLPRRTVWQTEPPSY